MGASRWRTWSGDDGGANQSVVNLTLREPVWDTGGLPGGHSAPAHAGPSGKRGRWPRVDLIGMLSMLCGSGKVVRR